MQVKTSAPKVHPAKVRAPTNREQTVGLSVEAILYTRH